LSLHALWVLFVAIPLQSIRIECRWQVLKVRMMRFMCCTRACQPAGLASSCATHEPHQVRNTFTGNFLMTYDDADEIRKLARRHGFEVETVAMKNTHHTEMTELLISRSLDWARCL